MRTKIIRIAFYRFTSFILTDLGSLSDTWFKLSWTWQLSKSVLWNY